MKPHVKLYFEGSGFDPFDFVPCEICGEVAVEIHHIDARGMGGDPQGKKDVFSNLMAVCRTCHIEYGDKKQHKDFLQNIHNAKFNLT